MLDHIIHRAPRYQAGKGRTGTIIVAYFLFCGLFDSADEALNFFAYRRSLQCWGVTGPAQLSYDTPPNANRSCCHAAAAAILCSTSTHPPPTHTSRYIQYAEDILKRGIEPSPQPLLLKSISLNMTPKFGSGPGDKGCTPFFEIYLLEREAHLLYSSIEMGDEIRFVASLLACVRLTDLLTHQSNSIINQSKQLICSKQQASDILHHVSSAWRHSHSL